MIYHGRQTAQNIKWVTKIPKTPEYNTKSPFPSPGVDILPFADMKDSIAGAKGYDGGIKSEILALNGERLKNSTLGNKVYAACAPFAL
jgi:hypothetical protein